MKVVALDGCFVQVSVINGRGLNTLDAFNWKCPIECSGIDSVSWAGRLGPVSTQGQMHARNEISTKRDSMKTAP